MIWLTWRQFRVSVLTVFGGLGAVALALALTGPSLSREYADLRAACGGARCHPEAFDDFFFSRLGVYLGLNALVIAVPAIVGVYGAPLQRLFAGGSRLRGDQPQRDRILALLEQPYSLADGDRVHQQVQLVQQARGQQLTHDGDRAAHPEGCRPARS